MEMGKKTIAAGIGLLFLGGLGVYLLAGNSSQAPTQKTVMQQEITSHTTATETVAKEMTHDTFLAEAEARREQQLIDRAEAERLEKLKALKQNSVECKFWKQQQKTDATAIKIDEKINQYCNLPVASLSSAPTDNNTQDTSLEN